MKFILTRAIIFYLVCLCLIWKLLDYNKLVNNAVPQTLNQLIPSIDYFAEFVDKKDHYDHFKLMDCINYHKAVVHFFNIQESEAYGMLGFCYERLGQEQEAVVSYQQAIAFNPDYFWPYYDLGIIAYGQAHYSKAQEYFYQALQQDPRKTIVLLFRSKVYSDVKSSQRIQSYDYFQGLKEGRLEAYVLIMDSLYKTGAYEELWKVAINGIKEGQEVQGIFYYYAALAAYDEKKYPQAIELLQLALRDDPQNSDALNYLGKCLRAEGNDKMAELVLKRATQMQEQGVEVIEQYLKPQVRFF